MTIYSQHANRGKFQILATYSSDAGVTSSTVTSVDDATAATVIVDALNRISQSACVPVSIRDERSESYKRYPSGHLAAITEPSRRPALLAGKAEHDLWYDYAMLMLHRALADLNAAVLAMPAPVHTAIMAELEAEARGLRVGLHEYEAGPSEEETERQWDFEDPFVPFDGGMTELSRAMRERLNRLEMSLPAREHAQAAEDLRFLYNVYIQIEGGRAILEEEHLVISFEHEDSPLDGFFLSTSRHRIPAIQTGNQRGQ